MSDQAPPPFEAPDEDPRGERRPAAPSTFRLMGVEQLMNMPPMKWIIEGILPEQAFAVTYGDPKSGKSLITLSQALCIASGIPWHGHDVIQGDVVYVAAEGVLGLPNRIRAWWAAHPDADLSRFHLLPQAVRLLNPHDAEMLKATVGQLAKKVGRSPSLLTIDTLARTMTGGDENSAKDMGMFIRHLDDIKEEYGTTTQVVHHTNRSGGERGSGALRGAADIMARASKAADTRGREEVTYRCSDVKDGSPFSPHHFRIQPEGLSVRLDLLGIRSQGRPESGYGPSGGGGNDGSPF